ncbi:FAD/NAD(P)-binding domain-containing protein [Calocera cornea HHB12733]|uniref:FAD/NAD(P)-binding domain-containing protein n=1 Tax=Calocera cornea HHB12733 TaxID=1353952 RepID=A0A165JUF7_9BASI|nr:FAD/NAD(P)-binding domain-containing protein [Calocera cornea HHB12733]
MSLPTFQTLGAIPPPTTQAQSVAEDWLSAFSSAIDRNNVPAVLSLFIDDAWWRDLLSLTWDFRSFHGANEIGKFLEDRLSLSQLSSIKLSSPAPLLVTPDLDLGWVQALFTFETGVGFGTAVVRIVYLETGEWKAWALCTILEDLKCDRPEIDFNYPERVEYASMREREEQFLDADPTVIIVGAGQAGLGLAARLKAVGVSSLIVERNDRVGDQWRKDRYASLRLHAPVWRDHLPFFPFPEPPLWPVFTPGVKLGDFLEAYAKHLDLNVWTSTTIQDPQWEASSKTWTVTIPHEGKARIMKTRHIVWAIGLDGGVANMPKIDGMDTFQGNIVHSSQYSVPEPYKGKKVVVIGAGVSAHDICMDLARQGTDVTMIQRSSTYIMSVKNAIPAMNKQLYWKGSPPNEVSDVLSNSLPLKLVQQMSVRTTARIAEMDKHLLDGLHRVGFKTNMGLEDAGVFRLVLKRGGGWYTDVGASQLLISGRIKLHTSAISHLTPQGMVFADGTSLPADVIICATGYGRMSSTLAPVFGEEFARGLGEVWDWDAEGEINSVWRGSGREGFYTATNNLPGCRFWSKFLALQIKAMEAGLFGPRYSRS